MISQSFRKQGYLLSVFGLTLFSLLSAGRDVYAKEMFNNQPTLGPIFLTFFMSLVSWLVFYLTASITRREAYRFQDFRRAPSHIKMLVYCSNLLTLIGFATAILSVDKTNAYVSGLLDYGGSPAISVLLAILFLRENPSRHVVLGLSISLIGVIVLIGGMTNGSKEPDQSANSLLGAAYAIVSAIAFGFNQIVNKKLVDYGIVRDRLWLVRLPLLIVALGIYILIDGKVPSLDAAWWLFLVAWAIAGTTLPLFLLVYAFEHMRVSNVASFLFLIPLFSFIGSLHLQHFSILQVPLYLACGILVLTGVIITEKKAESPTTANGMD